MAIYEELDLRRLKKADAIAKKELIEKYAESLVQGNAALFIGSGISVGLGADDWQSLLKGAADKLGFDLKTTKERLPDIIQYWINEEPEYNRPALFDDIKSRLEARDLEKDEYENSVYNYICHLPIKVIWTTNYDTLIESAYDRLAPDKTYETIQADQDILDLDGTEDVRIYKMHGSVATKDDNLIISTDDYIRYEREHKFFLESLKADLLQKTFLFVGFSFNDPNVRHILRALKLNLEDLRRGHQARLKRHFLILYSNIRSFKDEQTYVAERARLEDLRRYNIRSVRVYEKKESGPIKDILIKLKRRTFRKNVVLAGSSRSGTWGDLPKLSSAFGVSLIQNDREYVLHTCYGNGVGCTAIEGALQQCSQLFVLDPNSRVKVWPTYETEGMTEDQKKKLRLNRSVMVRTASVCVFFGGIKGTLEEFDIARSCGKFCIPVAFTGGITGKKIYAETMMHFDKMCDLYDVDEKHRTNVRHNLKSFENPQSTETVVKKIQEIIDIVHDRQ